MIVTVEEFTTTPKRFERRMARRVAGNGYVRYSDELRERRMDHGFLTIAPL